MAFSFTRPTFGQAGSGANQNKVLRTADRPSGFSDLPTTTSFTFDRMQSFGALAASATHFGSAAFGSSLSSAFQLRPEKASTANDPAEHILLPKPVAAQVIANKTAVVSPSTNSSKTAATQVSEPHNEDAATDPRLTELNNNTRDNAMQLIAPASEPDQSDEMELDGVTRRADEGNAMQLYLEATDSDQSSIAQAQNKRQRLAEPDDGKSFALPQSFTFRGTILNAVRPQFGVA